MSLGEPFSDVLATFLAAFRYINVVALYLPDDPKTLNPSDPIHP